MIYINGCDLVYWGGGGGAVLTKVCASLYEFTCEPAMVITFNSARKLEQRVHIGGCRHLVKVGIGAIQQKDTLISS